MKWTILLLTIALHHTINAQTTTFNNRTLIGCTNNTIFTSIHVTDSCYYIMGISREDGTCIPGSLFSKVDTLGNVMSYSITPRVETWMPSFQKTFDNNFINAPYLFDSLGKRGGVYKYDNHGNIIQRIIFDNPLNPGYFCTPEQVIQTRDSGYLVTHTAGDTLRRKADTYIFKFDKSGQQQWTQHRGFNNGLREINCKIYHNKSKETYTIGYQQDNIQITPNLVIIRCMLEQLDSAGNTLWTWESPLFGKEVYGANDLLQTQDGGWVIASALGNSFVSGQGYMNYDSDPYIFKLDSARNLVWERHFPNGYSQLTQFKKVLELADGSLVAAGEFNKLYPDTTNPSFGVYQWKIVKLATDGTVLWDRDYAYLPATQSWQHRLYDMTLTRDGGFLLAGDAAGTGQGPLQQGWLLKLDEHGCLVPGCHLVSSVLPPSATSTVELLLYPNPATQYLNVFYQSSGSQSKFGVFDKELSFSIINVQGQILQQHQSKATSGKTYLLDVEQLAAGSYFLEVKLDGKLIKTEQFVVKN